MPFPSHITEVRQALRAYIRRLDDEAVAGTHRFGTKRLHEQKRKQQNRWRTPVDLRLVAPVDGRPMTWSGATSFHFEMTGVSKAKGGTARTGDGQPRGPDAAREHERYLSDEEKLEKVLAADFERYLGQFRDEPLNPAAGSRAALMLSNISERLAEREAFWNEVWAHERTPGTCRIQLAPDRGSSEQWRDLADDPETPPRVADAVRELVLLTHQPGLKRRGRKRPKVITIALEDPSEVAWAGELGTRFGRSKAERLVHVVEARGGFVQQRLVAEFPEELDAPGRCAVVRSLGEDLGRLGVPFTVVVHAPDHRNDARNHHLHAIWYPRRCEWNSAGAWDVSSGRKLRPGDIIAALGDAADEAALGHHWAAASSDVKLMRMRFAEHCNDVLARLGVSRRYDPRPYAEMDIDQEPSTHLGTAAAALVAAGVHVPKDHENACKTWAARERWAARESAERRDTHHRFLQEMRGHLPADHEAEDEETKALFDRYERAARIVEEGRDALDKLYLDRVMAESAARRLERGTAQRLAAIECGDATADDRRDAKLIAARHRLAQCHLQEIAAAVEPWAEKIEAFRTEVLEAEQEVGSLELQIREHVVDRCEVSERQRWRSSTVLDTELHPQPLTPHAHFDALVQHVRAQNVKSDEQLRRVHLWVDTDNAIVIDGLRERDQEVLNSPAFGKRLDPAFRSWAAIQQKEIGRLVQFVAEHGLVNLNAGTRTEGTKAPSAVVRLHARYSNHPLFAEQAREADARYSQRIAVRAAGSATTPPSVRPEPVAERPLQGAASPDLERAVEPEVAPSIESASFQLSVGQVDKSLKTGRTIDHVEGALATRSNDQPAVVPVSTLEPPADSGVGTSCEPVHCQRAGATAKTPGDKRTPRDDGDAIGEKENADQVRPEIRTPTPSADPRIAPFVNVARSAADTTEPVMQEDVRPADDRSTLSIVMPASIEKSPVSKGDVSGSPSAQAALDGTATLQVELEPAAPDGVGQTPRKEERSAALSGDHEAAGRLAVARDLARRSGLKKTSGKATGSSSPRRSIELAREAARQRDTTGRKSQSEAEPAPTSRKDPHTSAVNKSRAVESMTEVVPQNNRVPLGNKAGSKSATAIATGNPNSTLLELVERSDEYRQFVASSEDSPRERVKEVVAAALGGRITLRLQGDHLEVCALSRREAMHLDEFRKSHIGSDLLVLLARSIGKGTKLTRPHRTYTFNIEDVVSAGIGDRSVEGR